MKAVFLDSASLLPMDRLSFNPSQATVPRDAWDIETDSLYQCCNTLACYSQTSSEQIIERCREADIIITNKVIIKREHMLQLKKLKLICVAATGINNVDIEAAQSNNIAVTNVAGYSTQSVVQICFTLILSLASKLSAVQHALETTGWHNHNQFVLLPEAFHELAGKTLGIIGYGTIGQAVASVAKSFGMTILKAQLPGRNSASDRIPLAQLLPQCDIVSLHCPQTTATQNLVDKSFLAQMKSSAILINTARGGLIDENALDNALTKKTIGGAGLDVLSSEPPSSDNPLLKPRPNLVLTPHIGWASQEARQRLVIEIAKNIESFKQQQRRNRIV